MYSELYRLFQRGSLREFLDQRLRELDAAVESFDANRLLSASIEELTGDFVSQYRLDVPRLRRDDAELEHQEAEIDPRLFRPNPNFFFDREAARIKGIRYTLHVPFDGDKKLFEYQPSTYTMSGSPIASVRDGTLVLTSDRLATDAGDVVSNGFNTILNDIEQWLGWVGDDIRTWLASLDDAARTRIQRRRDKLLAAKSAVASMGFKLRERPDATRTFAAPEVRRKVAPVPARGGAPAPGSSAPYTPEPMLADPDYEHIISVIGSMAAVIERSPAAFEKMEEEHLRFLFLVPLNGHYEGQATGETFNFDGKTDILIRAQGRNIFIAECKFWTGPKGLTKTVDQLLGYTSWRDTKTAILLFNRNKGFSAVLDQIRPTIEAHPNCKAFAGRPAETQFRFVLRQPTDASRELLLTVLAFDVPHGLGA
ncbi:hypothetical protein [Anaeromyxobacter dehalogenans]|uniref:Uncharacterized protein n=1 Tax=Anaeromyxobacter dehalogenans (strain 2CP-C) TaxID=290397 RepID=Q2IFF8_ANADE|nr:hypothetical protein [Anaeromyxobacter dehalogenans]ABC83312.1 conserved hypothetical protein [Anaeromyxobacter dehalogenans 2CP-C]